MDKLDKFESFALNTYLHDYPDNLSYNEIMKLLKKESRDILEYDIYEDYPFSMIMEFIENTRKHAKRVFSQDQSSA